MKVREIMPDPFKGVVTGSPLKLGDMYDRDHKLGGIINSKKVSKQTVTIKNAQTGEITGKRTVYQK
jgi:predicted deacylase